MRRVRGSFIHFAIFVRSSCVHRVFIARSSYYFRLVFMAVQDHRSRPQRHAEPEAFTAAQTEYFQEQIRIAVTEALKAAQPPPTPQPATQAAVVVVLARDVPDGLAGSFLSKYGYYPSQESLDRLQKLYVKLQPSLKGSSDLFARMTLAVRNCRAHLSRQIKATLCTLLAHTKVGDAVEVRCEVLFCDFTE